MLVKLKSLLSGLLPKVEGLISLAPFLGGVILGYILRTPISWALDLIKLLLKI